MTVTHKAILKTLAAATLIVACNSGFAQAAASASSPAKKELVAKLVAIQKPGAEILGQQTLQLPVQRMMQSALQALQQMPADKREAAAKAIEADVKKFIEDNTPMMKDRAAKLAPTTIGPILDEKFSEDELRQLLAWLESPVSKKFNQVSNELGKALQEKLLADAGPTLETRFSALQQSTAKHLGLNPQAAPAASKPTPAKK